MKHRKIRKYLETKELSLSVFDKILIDYINGKLEQTLIEMGFSKLEFFPKIRKKHQIIYVEFSYLKYRFETYYTNEVYAYDYYLPGASIEELEKTFVYVNYEPDFNLINLLKYLKSLIDKISI